MAKKYTSIDNLDDLMDFSDLGDLLQQSGIQISTATDPNAVANAQPPSTSSTSDPTDPFAQLMTQFQPLSVKPKDLDDCLICCHPLYIKVTLACGHEFCLGCIKGTLLRLGHTQSGECPCCFQPISDQMKTQIKKNPQQLAPSGFIKVEDSYLKDLDFYWFYSSKQRGQWWAYDIASAQEIETLYQESLLDNQVGQNNLSICGMVRVFDFDGFWQVNEYNQGRRKIKRVSKANIQSFLSSGQVKGLAGYKHQFDAI
jgi:hypothetical protein